jgi:hypothetical protein
VAALISQNCLHDIAWLFRQSVHKLFGKFIFFAISAANSFLQAVKHKKIIPDLFQSGMIFIINTGIKNHWMSKAAQGCSMKIVR